MSIQWLHWGCLKPTQLGQMGVNANGFHTLAYALLSDSHTCNLLILMHLRRAEDQLRVVDAIKQRKIPDQDLSAALKPPLELPKDIAPSQTAPPAPTVQPNWPPSKPSKGLMVPRKPKPGIPSSSIASSSQPPIVHTSATPSSSHTIDLTSSPARTGQLHVPSSSQSHIIDVSSSPVKPVLEDDHAKQGSTEASGSGSVTAQPGTVAEGRVVKAEREEEQDESEGSPEPDDDVFYLRHQDEVVGIQHYRGLVGVGERVVLVRLALHLHHSSPELTHTPPASRA
jgi:SWI/SNF-related matrix-associated actin-dependent regulator of chromatin subfamily A3